MKLEDVEKSVRISTVIAIVIIVAIPLSYVWWFYIENGYEFSSSSSVWGTFGDFVGGILNPLIAILAFYWLTQSVLIQKNELSESKNALEASSETQEKKRFEDTFFSLLDQHNKVLDQLQEQIIVHNRPQPSRLEKISSAIFKTNPDKTIEEARDQLHSSHNSVCGHYFRIVYQLLKLIAINCHGSEISEKFSIEEIKEKPVSTSEKLYSNILRSFLSFDVTKLLAVNCVCDDPEGTYYKYRLLIERYNFLEHMPLDNKISQQTVEKYDVRAFGKSGFLAEQKS